MTAVIVLAILVAGAVFVLHARATKAPAGARPRRGRLPADLPAGVPSRCVPQPGLNEQTFYKPSMRSRSSRTSASSSSAPHGIGVARHGQQADGGRHLVSADRHRDDIARGFVAWEPPNLEFPEQDLTLVAASSRFVTGTDAIYRSGSCSPFRPTRLPAHGSASARLGARRAHRYADSLASRRLLLARQVAQPVRKLTAASEAMARGDFDQRVEVEPRRRGRPPRPLVLGHGGARWRARHHRCARCSRTCRTTSRRR